MIKVNTFNKGQNRDSRNLYQPSDTAKEIHNFVQIDEGGELYSLTNEKGTTKIEDLPAGFSVIGQTVLDKDIILILAHPLGYSQVGTLRDNVYTRNAPSTDTGSEFGFQIDKPVDCVARKVFTGDRVLYFTDNNQPFGLINLDNPPEDADIGSSVKLIPELTLPNIDYVEQLESGGSLSPGVYQFAVRYVNEDNTTTTLSIPTNPIPVVDETRSVGKERYDGDSQTGDSINKSIVLRLTEIDSRFSSFEIIAISYESITNTFSAYVLPEVSINGTTQIYTFGSTLDGVPITLEELRALDVTYDKAKCIEQKDNRLILGNLSESTNRFDDELQQIANNIQIKYNISEEEYHLPTVSPGEFSPVEAYVMSDSEIDVAFSNTPKVVRLLFSGKMIATSFTNPVSSTNQNPNYSVFKNGTKTEVSIQVTDYTVLSTDTLILEGSDLIDHNYVFDTDISVGASNDETAENIYNFLLLQSEITDLYDLSYSADTVTLTAVELSSTTYNVSYTDSGSGIGLTTSNTPGIDPILVASSIRGISISNRIIYILADTEVFNTSTDAYSVDFTNFLAQDGVTTTSDNVDLYAASITSSGDTLLYSSTLDNYKLEEKTVYEKTYRRGEVYSFAYVVEFKNGSRSFAFHIPGNDKAETVLGKHPADTGTGLLGTYVSSFEYPQQQGYPGNLSGDDTSVATIRNIRHHVMPTIQQEPHFSETVSGAFIRKINLSFEFVQGFSQDLKNNVSKVYIVRESRSNSDNRSILAQGITKNMREHYSEYASAGAFVPTSKKYKKVPGFGESFNVINLDFRRPGGTTGTKPKWAIEPENLPSFGSGANNDLLQVFYSPELHFNFLDRSLMGGSYINPVMNLDVSVKTNLKGIGLNSGVQATRSSVNYNSLYSRTILTQERYPKVWMYGNYNNPSAYTGTAELIEDSVEVDGLNDGNISGVATPLSGNLSTKYYVLKTQNSVTYPTGSLTYTAQYADDAVRNNFTLPSPILLVSSNDSYTSTDEDYTTIVEGSNKLVNVERQNYLIQYGSISASEYIYVDTISFGEINNGFVKSEVYGGDTFIGKIALIEKDVFEYLPKYEKATGTILNVYDTKYESSGTAADGCDPDYSTQGLDIRAIHHFFVESSVNFEYRNEFTDDDGNLQTRYFPKSYADDAMGTAFEKGLATSYNTQYSYENKVLSFFSRGSNDLGLRDFSTRIIYSSISQPDSLVDNYRTFPQNNFQDVPRETGEIWDLFVESDTVYAHTPKSLWRLYSNPKAISATDIGQVVLGTGDAYNISPQGKSEMKGGYAGSISQFAGTHTPAGYIFPDVLQGKVFSLQGGRLEEISKKGMIKYFDENLYLNYIDNPYTGEGLLGAYDFSNKRYIIVKNDSGGGFAQSFSFLSDSWLSEHGYRPNVMIAFNNQLYFIKDDEIWEMNTGDRGNYFGTIYNSSLKYVENDNPIYNKVFDNLYIKSTTSNGGVNLTDATFDTIKVVNDFNESDTETIQVRQELNPILGTQETLCRFKNEEYKLSIPRDNSKVSFQKRIKGQYAEIDLNLLNDDNDKFVLDYIKTVYRINHR